MSPIPLTPPDVLHLAHAASARIDGSARKTPLEHSASLSSALGLDVHLKLENLQHTGSFKCRGALSAISALTEATRNAGVVAASTGNHGMAVAFAAQRAGCQATIYVPHTASPLKVGGIRALGATVIEIQGGCLEAECAARRAAEAAGQAFISPYNDRQVVGGQGTVGLEIFEDAPHLDAVFVSVGGGGLISGVGGVLKALNPAIEIVGCQPTNSCVMQQSVAAGRVIEAPESPTLSDGTAGGVEAGALTFPVVQQVVDRWVLVDEDSIAEAFRRLFNAERWLVEGAAAMALAGLIQTRHDFAGRAAAVILCGRNIAPGLAAQLLAP